MQYRFRNPLPLLAVAGALYAISAPSLAQASLEQGGLQQDPAPCESRPGFVTVDILHGDLDRDGTAPSAFAANSVVDGGAVSRRAVMRPSDALHLGRVGETLWVRGTTYKASVDDTGFTYIPFLGSQASRNWPISFRLTGASAGGAPLALDAAPAEFDGDTAVLQRGAVQARYHLSKDSVEQTFTVARDAVGAGDLVLEVAVTTELAAARDGQALVFAGPDGEVRFGAATVLDSTGRAEALTTEWDGAKITFRVPAAFVADAAGAVIVDPLITTTTVDSYIRELTRPDVAFDFDQNVFSVVYEESFSAVDGDLYYRTLDGTTLALVDEGYIEASSVRAYDPHVATIASTDRFVVVYVRDDPFGLPEIYTRARLAAPGSSWQVEYVVALPDEFFTYEDPDIGGEAFEGPGSSNAAVVFEEKPRGTTSLASGIRARLIGDDGVPVPSFVTIVPSIGPQSMTKPTISKYTGDPFAHAAWWIAYLAGPAGAPAVEVHNSRLTFSGSVSESDTLVWSAPQVSAIDGVEVSSPYFGFLTESFHMVLDETFAGAQRTSLRTRARTGAGPFGPAIPLQQKDISADTPKQQGAFATTTDRALLTYFDRSAVTGRQEVRSSSLELVPTLGAAGVGERRILLGELTQSAPVRTSAASKASGGTNATSQQVFVVWQDEGTPGGDSDIFGALLDLPEPSTVGNTFCRGFPNSTGDYGFLAAYGDNGLTTPKDLVASNLPTSTLGYFLASRTEMASLPPNSQGRLCLGGSIGRYAGNVLNSGTGGRFVFSMDPTTIAAPGGSVAALAGQTWSFQAWHRDANPTSTSNFTNAIQITF